MRKPKLWTLLLMSLSPAGFWVQGADEFRPEAIIALERAALDRWGKGDPGGYLSIYDAEITYFDPAREARADGLPAMEAYYAPIAGKIKVDRYEMIAPKCRGAATLPF